MYCPKLEVFLCVVLLTALHVVGSKATPNENSDLFKAALKGPAADQSTNSNLTFSLPGLTARSNIFGSLYNRQEETCEYPVPCDGNTWCCPEGSQCCTTVPDCCPDDSNCRSGGKCCPKTAETCGGVACTDAGSECCGNPVEYACPPGQECNTEGGQFCCDPDEMKCNGGCCPPGSTCASISGYCSSIASSTQSSTSSSAITSTIASTSISTSISISISESTMTTTQTPACTPGSSRRDIGKRQRPFPKYCTKVCHLPSGLELPVWEISYRVGETDQLVLSMCTGMAQRIAEGNIGSPVDGEDILTYNGKGNRVEADCDGFCTQLSIELITPMQCDEYPPATLNQEKGVQTKVCIPQYQNSGTQGPMWAQVIKRCGLEENDKVLIKIDGGCSQYTNLPPPNVGKRSIDTSSFSRRTNGVVDLASSNDTLRDPYGDGSLLYVATQIDYLANGHYDFQVNFDGAIESVEILNLYGDVYANASSLSGSAGLSFDIDDGSNLPAALIAYTNKTVNVSYTGTGQLTNSSTTGATPSASATISTKSKSSKVLLGYWWGVLLFGVLIVSLIH